MDALSAAVLIASPVKAVALAATLLEKAIYSSAVGVLCVLVTIGYLYPLELDNSCDIRIYCALSKELPFLLPSASASAGGKRNASRRNIGLTVVREHSYRLSDW